MQNGGIAIYDLGTLRQVVCTALAPCRIRILTSVQVAVAVAVRQAVCVRISVVSSIIRPVVVSPIVITILSRCALRPMRPNVSSLTG
jgi:hypothetical protein